MERRPKAKKNKKIQKRQVSRRQPSLSEKTESRRLSFSTGKHSFSFSAPLSRSRITCLCYAAGGADWSENVSKMKKVEYLFPIRRRRRQRLISTLSTKKRSGFRAFDSVVLWRSIALLSLKRDNGDIIQDQERTKAVERRPQRRLENGAIRRPSTRRRRRRRRFSTSPTPSSFSPSLRARALSHSQPLSPAPPSTPTLFRKKK